MGGKVTLEFDKINNTFIDLENIIMKAYSDILSLSTTKTIHI